MTPPIFLDTSGWVAAVNPRDRYHGEAAAFYCRAQRDGCTFVLTNLVLAEAHALVGRRLGDAVALRLLDHVRADPAHRMVWSTAALERDAVDRWLRPRLGRGISLADAVSFEVMRRERIEAAFTFDADFQAAGFEAVP